MKVVNASTQHLRTCNMTVACQLQVYFEHILLSHQTPASFGAQEGPHLGTNPCLPHFVAES